MDRIIIIRSTYSPYGGIEQVALNLVKGLLAHGAHITLLTMPGQPWPVASRFLTIVPSGITRGHRLLTAWAFNRAVTRFLAEKHNEIILSLDRVVPFSHLHAGGGTHKAFLRIKNAHSGVIVRNWRRLSLFHRYMLHLERKGFANPLLRKVHCMSQLVKRDIAADYAVPEDKLVVVPSGIRWQAMGEVFENRNTWADRLCRMHHICADWHCLLFLGSGFSRKGLDIAIRGLQTLAPVYHLLVVGKGATREYARLAASLGLGKRVHFLGAQPDGWRYAAISKAMVLPSRYEPFGGAAAEAHAMGIPVLVSDHTGYMDYVIHGQNGVIVKSVPDQSELEDAFSTLSRLVETPCWLPVQMREHARELDDMVVLGRLMKEFLV